MQTESRMRLTWALTVSCSGTGDHCKGCDVPSVSIELSVPCRIPTLLHGPGCNLGEWKGCTLVVHYLVDLQSVHRFRCYDNTARTQNVFWHCWLGVRKAQNLLQLYPKVLFWEISTRTIKQNCVCVCVIQCTLHWGTSFVYRCQHSSSSSSSSSSSHMATINRMSVELADISSAQPHYSQELHNMYDNHRVYVHPVC